jgi:hypothetical protein
MADDAPKIHIDSDWKAEAQRDKERLAQKAEAAPKAGAAGAQGQMPPANFETLVSTIVTQALFALGAIPDPRTGQRYADLDLARHHIDMLGVIEEKTKGNLSEEEANMVASAAYELRSRYLQVSTQARTR